MEKHRTNQANGIALFLRNTSKGIAIGTANVVPGLSGGTIALLLGVFERLIRAVKSIDIKAIQLLLRGRFREFSQHIDLYFLLAIFLGLGLGNILLAKLIGQLFENYPVYTWAFFFGLVLASLYFVVKSVASWNISAVFALFCGLAVALIVTDLPPSDSNAASWYLILCGVIAICSMILPGLSGSYVLILLGNYQLVMLEGVGKLQLGILAPFLLGAVVGLLAFSHLLNWLLQKCHSQTIASLCGFIAGSLRSLWPWKQSVLQTFGTKEKVVGYKYLAPQWDTALLWVVALVLLGAALLILLELWSRKTEKSGD